MGQDRKFTEQQKEVVYKAVIHFSKIWQQQENKNLERDVNRRVEKAEEDKTFLERAKVKFDEVSEKWVEQNFEETEENKSDILIRLDYKKKILNGENIEIRPESPSETKKDERRDRRAKKKEIEENKDESKDLIDEEVVNYTEKWNKDLIELKDNRVIKMARIIQAVFYLLKYSRKDI